ncbi:MAG: cytochrome P450 [Aeromicrobium sp.]
MSVDSSSAEKVANEIDLDHHSARYAEEWPELYAKLRKSECPVAHSSAYDGFWVPSRYEDIGEIARDTETFTSEHDIMGDTHGYGGVVIPPAPVMQVPIELDGPEFKQYRALLNPKFTPNQAKEHDVFLTQLVDTFLNKVCESGSMDLIEDLANPIPAILTLHMLGLPTDDWEPFARPFHAIAYEPPGTDGFNKAVEGIFNVMVEAQKEYEERVSDPQEGLISFLATAEVDGEPLPLNRVLEIITLIFVGGVDTTTALVSNALIWLSEHDEERQRLIDNPDLLPQACEEMLRYFSPAHALARTVTRDVELGGQQLKENDRILLPWCAANRDPEVFDAPDEVILDRFPNRHMAFGVGPHRCLGSNIARREFLAMVSGILRRMPDIKFDLANAARYTSVGSVNGWVSLPATFAPSQPVPVSLDL